jgi:hypothetical protein
MEPCINNILNDQKLEETSLESPLVKVSPDHPLNFNAAFLGDVLLFLLVDCLFHCRKSILEIKLGLKAASGYLILVIRSLYLHLPEALNFGCS